MASPIPPLNDLVEKATKAFTQRFNKPPEVAACAPGRVNLIGEHTDYNEGFVLPMALPLVTVVVGRKNGTKMIRVLTTSEEADQPHYIEFRADDIIAGTPKWANYVKGSIAFFRGLNTDLVPGFDAAIASSVPFGGGVSSSAALEVSVHTFLEALTKKVSDPQEKALACQQAEHVYAGMPCGIMDQFISVMGKKDCALLIDCRRKLAEAVPVNNPDYVILITNSNVHHELTGSEYPTRRAQCHTAAEALSKQSLRDATEEDLQVLKDIGLDDVIIRRARHVVREIKRTLDGAHALRQNQYEVFGKLMVESHNSLRDDFEVSCPELDTLVEAALKVKGVLGSRMTGGGFGGCTVTLVHKSAVDATIQHIKKTYEGTPTFYVVTPSEGCRQIPLPTSS